MAKQDGARICVICVICGYFPGFGWVHANKEGWDEAARFQADFSVVVPDNHGIPRAVLLGDPVRDTRRAEGAADSLDRLLVLA